LPLLVRKGETRARTVTSVRIKEASEDDNMLAEQDLIPLVPLSTGVERGRQGER
jgi:hypothetical protein